MYKIVPLNFIFLLFSTIINAQSARDAAVQLYAEVQSSPPQIKLNWVGDSYAVSYTIYKKNISDVLWGTAIATLAGTETSYLDNNVSINSAYEYKIEEVPDSAASRAGNSYGYIYAGINLPEVENRGTVIFIVDNSFSEALSSELLQMEMDMIGDGWTVTRHNVEPSSSVESVKALITHDYNSNSSSVKAVYLFGHIPQPYSGDMAPDGHGNHIGAWPADVFYGDIDGVWTDSSVNDTSANNTEITNSRHNNNIPGDGKYDQSSLPSDVELEVGRVDLNNMPIFTLSEQELLRRYLNKDHDFRHGIYTATRAGLVNDYFGYFSGEAFAANSFRNFAPMFGPTKIKQNKYTYFSTLKTSNYLWSYLTGAGKGDGQGILFGEGTVVDFTTDSVNTVFTMLFGSYFGDWDVPNNFLRGAIASAPMCLGSFWAGRPHWFVHHMGLGENIGYSARLSQNNLIYDPTYYSREVHVGLMGDPTLRMHIVTPPVNLVASRTDQVSLKWNKSADQILGYHIYRSSDIYAPFVRINNSLITDTNFVDASPLNGKNVYMLRAVKLETSASGTYYNLSQGIFQTIDPVSHVEENLKKGISVSVSPNPAKNSVEVFFENINHTDVLVTLINSRGEIIMKNLIHNKETKFSYKLNIESQPEGIYLLKVESENYYTVKKFIKN